MNGSSTTRAPQSIAELDERLSEPSAALVDGLATLEGDLLVLGAGGKMGPSVARMARRAVVAAGSGRRVWAVSRFGDAAVRGRLDDAGIETVAADLLDARSLDRLPDCANVIYLAGVKFGTTGDEPRLWATNVHAPALVARRFRHSRIVCLSTGNVYGLVPAGGGRGSLETDPVQPVGEYAMSCLGRERVLAYVSEQCGTAVATLRLNYATEMRYGVLVDLATKIAAGQLISLEVGAFNVIWQGDACDFVLRSLALADSPPVVLNLTGPETVSCREVCERLGQRLDREPRFTGSEGATALLSDASRALEQFGPPRVTLETLIDWTADWIRRGGEVWQKPTHFEVRDGKY